MLAATMGNSMDLKGFIMCPAVAKASENPQSARDLTFVFRGK